jgi:hypothetical protein
MMVESLVVKDGEIVPDPVVPDPIVPDPVVPDPVDDVDDVDVDDVDPDKPGEPDWMKEDDDSQALSDTMPISAHIRAKRKLKGKIGEKDSEIEELRKEIQELKSQRQVIPPKGRTLVRPNRDAFDTMEEYEAALDEYEDKRIESKLSVVQGQNQSRVAQTNAMNKLNAAVDGHYLRADKLITESGISAETYKQADEVVRNAVEAVRPGFGNIIVDQVISILGEGSEKVLYKIGRSKALRGELITLLSEDPHGLRATAFLGEMKAKLSLTTKRKSNAPPPSSETNGDSVTSSSERVFRKKYDSAHNSGNSQAAYNAKKAAKAAGVDTSSW